MSEINTLSNTQPSPRATPRCHRVRATETSSHRAWGAQAWRWLGPLCGPPRCPSDPCAHPQCQWEPLCSRPGHPSPQGREPLRWKPSLKGQVSSGPQSSERPWVAALACERRLLERVGTNRTQKEGRIRSTKGRRTCTPGAGTVQRKPERPRGSEQGS